MGREVRRVALGLKWPPTEPPGEHGFPAPPGEGWQMWNTTKDDGLPISPVCKTPEELARWLVDNKASAFAGQTATYREWHHMITGPGIVFTAAMVNGEMISGVSAIMKPEDD